MQDGSHDTTHSLTERHGSPGERRRQEERDVRPGGEGCAVSLVFAERAQNGSRDEVEATHACLVGPVLDLIIEILNIHNITSRMCISLDRLIASHLVNNSRTSEMELLI